MNATTQVVQWLADHPEFGSDDHQHDDNNNNNNNNRSGRRGVTIELSDHVADELRRKLYNNNNNNNTTVKGLDLFLPQRDIPIVPDDQDWDCVMPNNNNNILLEEERLVEGAGDEEPNDAEEADGSADGGVSTSSDPDSNNDRTAAAAAAASQPDYIHNDIHDDDDDDLSYTPPPTRPVVWVDVERLTGYVPTTHEEWDTLHQSVRTALLWGAGGAQDTTTTSTTLDFDERVTELFATGVARHADTTTAAASSGEDTLTSRGRYVAVDYPEYLVVEPTSSSSHSNNHNNNDDDDNSNNNNNNNNIVVHSTARIWKRLLQPHPIPVVERLWHHLRHCSRSLLWKRAMHQEWRALVQCQENIRRQQQLQQWQQSQRPEQLERLYTVRETLLERVQQARHEQTALEQQRDVAVQRELLRRRRNRTSRKEVDDDDALDWESSVLAFSDDNDVYDCEDEEYRQFLERQQYHDQEAEQSRARVSLDDDNDDDDDICAENILEDTNHASNALTPSDDAAAAAAAIVSTNNSDEDQTTVEHETDDTVARALPQAAAKPKTSWEVEEEAVRESCTTHKLLLAMTVTLALQSKLQQVDDLLESLQEEQWAEEEEQEQQQQQQNISTSTETETHSQEEEEHGGVSVLDQVLAMILGATPPPEGTSMEDHIKFLEREHLSIVEEWKEYFGCLPPSLPSMTEKSPAAAEECDWEDVAAAADNTTTTLLPEATTTPQDLRLALGIVENENDDWDSGENDHHPPPADFAPQPRRPPTDGLRPGGRTHQRQ